MSPPSDAPIAREAGGHPARRYELLLRRHEIEVRLADRLGAGCGFTELFTAITELTDLDLWLYDHGGHVTMSARTGGTADAPDVDLPDVDLSDVDAEGVESASRERCPRLGIVRTASGVARRCLMEPVSDPETGEPCDWLVMVEGDREFGSHDRFLLERGGVYLARHRSLHHAVHRSISERTRGLVERLLRRTELDRSSAELASELRIDAESTCVVVAVDDSVGASGIDDIDVLTRAMGDMLDCRVLGARTPRGPALIVDAGRSERVGDSRLIEDVCRCLAASMPQTGIQCGVSGAVGVTAISDGYEEALEIVACLERFTAEHTRILSVRDLGPARILVANGNIAAIRRYVEHTLGPLWTDQSDSDMETLMATLAQFSRGGHNVRRTAAVMSVHENTVRQRLARVRKLTGLDVLNDPFAQLSVHTALSIIALRNRAHPLWDPRARGSQRLGRSRPTS
ncbi:PucR family transcriptional regulator [Gordonia terrae]|uniref:PucR family transcriptional regulator n=1 Tax=Gordonia terrae TaxID=2055 RepID=UPI003F6D00A4